MKFTLSESLISYIKNERKNRKITVSEFSEGIGKSKSYITKFDNGEFKNLTEDDFKKVFLTLANNDNKEAQRLSDKYFLSLLKNKDNALNPIARIDILNYDYIIRQLELPEILIDKFNEFLMDKKIPLKEIVDLANENKPVSKYSNYNNAEFNEYSFVPDDIASENGLVYIKLRLDYDYIRRIFDKEISVTNYISLLSVLNAYYLKVMKNDDDYKNDFNALTNDARFYACNFLFNFQFYSLDDYEILSKKEETKANIMNSLNEVSNSIQSTLLSYINLIIKIYNQDSNYIENKIKGLDKNLSEDAGFYIASLDLPLYKVKDINTSSKKELLKEMSALIDKYASEKKETIELL